MPDSSCLSFHFCLITPFVPDNSSFAWSHLLLGLFPTPFYRLSRVPLALLRATGISKVQSFVKLATFYPTLPWHHIKQELLVKCFWTTRPPHVSLVSHPPSRNSRHQLTDRPFYSFLLCDFYCELTQATHPSRPLPLLSLAKQHSPP